MSQAVQRLKKLDILRIFAISVVIMAHGLNRVYTFTPKATSTIALKSLLFGTTLRVLGGQSIPIFFMLTGYLILGREFKTKEDIFGFWKKKLLPLVVCYEIWLLIYQLFDVFILKNKFNVIKYIYGIFGMSKSVMSLMWYMPYIIGIYFVIPFLSILVHNVSPKPILIAIGAAFVINYFVPNVNILLGLNKVTELNNQFYAGFLGGWSGFYLIIGYYIRQYAEPRLLESSKKSLITIVLAITSLATLLINGAFMAWLLRHNYDCLTSDQYKYLLAPINGIAFFLLILTIAEKIPGSKLWNELGEISFGLYFLHYPIVISVVNALQDKVRSLKNPVEVLIYFLITMSCSLILAELISYACPPLAKLLFLRKPVRTSKNSQKQ